MQSQTKWFLRRGGAVYGPVEQTTLEEWARTGRIRPDDRISADGVTWSAPAEMEFLEMEWIVEPVGGRQVGQGFEFPVQHPTAVVVEEQGALDQQPAHDAGSLLQPER